MPIVAIGIGTLMAGHWAPLPEPRTGPMSPLAGTLSGILDAETNEQDQWAIFHVLYNECGCSSRVLEYLLDRPRTDLADEWLLLVHDDDAPPSASGVQLAHRAGLKVHPVPQSTLAKDFGVTAAPLFVAVDPSKLIRYCGGYTERKQGSTYLDLKTLDALVAGASPAPVPVYGCGVSRSLQASLDPLSLKY